MSYVSFKRIVSAALAAAITAAGTSFSSIAGISSANAEDIMKYEFEDGKTSGGKIYSEGVKGVKTEDFPEDTDLSNYSGKGFSYLDQKGTTVSVEVDVPEAGLYEMNISYCEPSDPRKKVQYLQVNNVNQGEVTFPYTPNFKETSAGIVNLKAGKNTIEFKAYWGYTFFDYLTLKPAPEKIRNLSPTKQLSNPNASDSAKRLYSYLLDQYGNHIIAGQQEYCGEHNYNSWNSPDVFIKDNEAEFEYIKEQTGKQPAIRGIDFLAYNTSMDWRDHAPERCIEWVNKYHGIATVTWHWNVPSDEEGNGVAFYVESASATYTTFSISRALTEGTWENKKLLADIELIAGEMQKLKEADVPILWRPLHEAEGAWFWWGAEGPEPCKKLYRLLYDKLTNEYGLDNLIWIWTGSTSPAASEWYPGDDVVDIVGYDKYNAADGLPNLSSIASTFYSLVQGTDGEKMVAMTENDSIPSVDSLIDDKAGWLYFCPWYMNYLTSEQNNPVDNLKEIYNSEYCITLDELPDLKKYPMADDDTPRVTTTKATTTTSSAKATTTTTTVTASEDCDIHWGDANTDGHVSVGDAVAILQNIGNKDKYELSPEGKRNADVYDNGDGISSKDALSIMKYDAHLIDKLPESYKK
ncbi:MAG: glycoside hydrolase [Ruminococcus sp.]|nr:glycoside hydrolase [Ruminococcus sp.]